MKIFNHCIKLNTKGSGDLQDLTPSLRQIVGDSGLSKGSVLVFVVGSTAAVITFEFEPGLIKDVSDLFEKIVPSNKHYSHDDTWGDANGYSHLRAALTGQSLAIPFEESKPCLGMWQQVVFAEFDNKPRNRQVLVQVMGE